MATPYTAQLALLESSGGRRMRNPVSGATGKFQFMPATWADLMQRFPNAGLTPAGIMDNSDGGQQDIALDLFNASNNRVLRKSLGRDPLAWETYAAHRFGAGGAQDLLGAPDDTPARLMFPADWIRQNPDIANKTAGEIRSLFQGRFGQSPPIEVAARPPALPVQEVPPMAQSIPQPQVPGLLADASAAATKPQDASGWGGLLGEGGDWKTALVAGLMSLGDGLRGGSGTAGLTWLTQQQQQKLAQDYRGLQMGELRDKQAQRQAMQRAATAYADRLEAAGHADLATAVRGNPSLMDEVLKQQAQNAFPRQEAYTLTPGSIRFDADGKPIASVPQQPSQDLVPVFDPATGLATYRKKSEADGLTAPPPRGVTVNLNNGQDTAAQRRALAESLGVPLAEVSPYDNSNLSPKGRENLFIANQKAAEKRWADMTEADAQHRQTIADMQRFKELNGKVSTGGMLGLPGVGAAAGLVDSDVAELRAITAKIAPNMRPPGSGATSDFDAKQFERATVGIDKPKMANENIANARIAAAQLALDRGAFERAYFDANGHLQGADRAWQQYLTANPIFDPQGKDYALNANRVGWRDYFRPSKPAVPTGELDFDPATGTFKPRGR
jgi:hypothetical protein